MSNSSSNLRKMRGSGLVAGIMVLIMLVLTVVPTTALANTSTGGALFSSF
jgi:hypothetical protein